MHRCDKNPMPMSDSDVRKTSADIRYRCFFADVKKNYLLLLIDYVFSFLFNWRTKKKEKNFSKFFYFSHCFNSLSYWFFKQQISTLLNIIPSAGIYFHSIISRFVFGTFWPNNFLSCCCVVMKPVSLVSLWKIMKMVYLNVKIRLLEAKWRVFSVFQLFRI